MAYALYPEVMEKHFFPSQRRATQLMKTKGGEDLVILAGVSVTTTLPKGSPSDVKRELDWLVEYGPRTGLMLAGSSSIALGVPWENMVTLVEGLRYYRTHGRSG